MLKRIWTHGKGGPLLRHKIRRQTEFDFRPSNLKVTNEYYEKYEAMSTMLDANPKIVDLVHADLKLAREVKAARGSGGALFRYTSDSVIRILVCQIVEGLSLRSIVVRVDDSHCLRRFTRIADGPMMDYTTLCKLKNCIRPATWKKVNETLARHATREGLVHGEMLRLDTTAVETNIHWPTDSSLLWDTYRVLARLIKAARRIDATLVGDRRLQIKKAKRLSIMIARKARPGSRKALEPLYERLIQLVLSISEWADSVALALKAGVHEGRYDLTAEAIAAEIQHYRPLGLRAVDQASRRVLDGEQVPNDEKLFSIFEPHTELLQRGKAGKPIEFGHMIQIQQVESKFITDYGVFAKRPVEPALLWPALQNHKKLFGDYPRSLAADKGYYESMAAIERLGEKIEVVSIAKKGRRSAAETRRESDTDFCAAQRFRAGVEGTISFLKRVLGLFRCFNKGWAHYVGSIGAAIFAHNLLILSRG